MRIVTVSAVNSSINYFRHGLVKCDYTLAYLISFNVASVTLWLLDKLKVVQSTVNSCSCARDEWCRRDRNFGRQYASILSRPGPRPIHRWFLSGNLMTLYNLYIAIYNCLRLMNSSKKRAISTMKRKSVPCE